MPLTKFEVVHRDEHGDDCVVIAAKDGKDRVVAFIGREEAHPVVPGSSTYRGGGPNLKRGWVSSFRVP